MDTMNQLMAMGRKWNGQPLFPTRSEDDVVRALQAALERRVGELKVTQKSLATQVAFRGEIKRRIKDPADPKQAGWLYLHNAADPQAAAYAEALRPLAELRGMAAKTDPLMFHGEPPEAWLEWLNEHYHGRIADGGQPPGFVLVVGGPDQVPFGLQALLQTVASVGRLVPDRIEDLRAYVEKLVRLEGAADPVVDREVFFFGTDEGIKDPTYFSREYMVDPLAAHVRNELGYSVRTLTSGDATKAKLSAELRSRRPALVYTASHGLGAVDESIEIQERYNGAICCHGRSAQPLDDLFTADDVPMDAPFLEGSVFFQFACYGYGTPAESDYRHWLEGMPGSNAARDFAAALPKRLIAHPRGPIAYIGHVDTAFLHGFADANNPFAGDRWHRRIAPFKQVVDGLLRDVVPPGLAMETMGERYSAANAVLTSIYDASQRRATPWSTDKTARFLDNWIVRSDAQNFMVMGDPAALVRIPS